MYSLFKLQRYMCYIRNTCALYIDIEYTIGEVVALEHGLVSYITHGANRLQPVSFSVFSLYCCIVYSFPFIFSYFFFQFSYLFNIYLLYIVSLSIILSRYVLKYVIYIYIYVCV